MDDKILDISAAFAQFKSIGVLDIIDILLVALVIYAIFKFIRDRRAGKLAVGILILSIVLLLSSLIGLKTMTYIVENFFQIGLVALVIVFQPELRSALEKMGGEPLNSLKNIGDISDSRRETGVRAVGEITEACRKMAADKTGALIVIERTANLDIIAKGGTALNCDISSSVIGNIFYKGAPLHDGAVIIRNWKINRAACLLPLSENDKLPKSLGTRHHAAVGISEESDAIAVVVSEETGNISMSVGGKLLYNLTPEMLENRLNEIFELGENKKKKKKNGEEVTNE